MSHHERIVPDETAPGIVALHLKRYDFAARFCREKAVLDAGCGVGYGSAHLGHVARTVLGVDASEEAIRLARTRYAAKNVSFAVMDVTSLDLPDRSLDVVCSLETIEHLDDPEAAFAEAARVLAANGAYVVSTPRAERTTTSPENPFHRVEFAPDDLAALLSTRFGHVELFGQRRAQTLRHRLAQRLDVLGLRKRSPRLRRLAPLLGTAPMAEATLDDVEISPGEVDRASEVIAVCRQPRTP